MAIETVICLLIALIVLGFVMFALGMRFWYNAKNSRQTVISGVVAALGVVMLFAVLTQVFSVRHWVPVNEVTTQEYALQRFTFPHTEFVVEEEPQALEVSISYPESHMEGDLLVADSTADGSVPTRTITLTGEDALQSYVDGPTPSSILQADATSVPLVLLDDDATEQGYFYLQSGSTVNFLLTGEDGLDSKAINTHQTEVELCADVAFPQQAYLEEVVRVTARDEGSVFGIAIDPNEQTETKYFFHLPAEYLYANGADHYYSYLFPEMLARQLLATTEA